MKRVIAAGLTTVLFLLAGCSGGADAAVDPQAAVNVILDQVPFRDSLEQARGDVALEYYDLDETVAEHAIYISGSGATAEEVAVLKLAPEARADKALAAAEKRVSRQLALYRDYRPEEVAKLERPVLIQERDLVFLVLADDPGRAEEVIRDILSGKLPAA